MLAKGIPSYFLGALHLEGNFFSVELKGQKEVFL